MLVELEDFLNVLEALDVHVTELLVYTLAGQWQCFMTSSHLCGGSEDFFNAT
jgi:hypothetical protein